MRDVITGEAVVVELPVAQLASRSLAFAIDAGLVLLVDAVILFGYALTGLLGSDPAFSAALIIGTSVLVLVGVPVTVETLSRGRSLGKLVLGLRVVRDDGGPVRFRHALARGLAGFVVDFGIVSGFTGAVALFSSLISPRGKRIGDLLAGTVVVRDRVRTATGNGILMPPQLAGWASTLAVAQVPDALALSVRQFLLRAPEMDPHARATMAVTLGTETAAMVSPPAPPGTPPEAFLAAVLAERSRREAARLAVEHSAETAVPASLQRTAPAPRPQPPPPSGGGFTVPR